MIAAYEGATGRRLWKTPSSAKQFGRYTFIDHTGTIVSMHTDDSNSTSLREMPSGQWLGTFAETIHRREGLVPGAAHWVGYELHRRGVKDPLLSLDPSRVSPAGTYPFNPAGTHVAWGQTDGTVRVADIDEVQRCLAAVGLGW